jgi:hypothetical protein
VSLHCFGISLSSRLISNSVVGWDTARFAPATSAIQHPLFITDIPGWRNDDIPKEMTFEEDRAYLEDAIGKLDAGSQSPRRIEHLHLICLALLPYLYSINIGYTKLFS